MSSGFLRVSARPRGLALTLVGLLGLLPLLAACAPSGGGASSSGGSLTSVSLALDWTPNTNHTGVYAALA
ncbi:MAG TPA: hypothetical protein VE338_16375, partial [Ktedonobacterales bacterium]|nr:hypothetical protein [Ktedonobacterales bacterium]